MLIEAQWATESLYQSSNLDEFSITGTLFHFQNGTSENWQKTLGAFEAWGSADVVYENGEYTMIYTINVKDRYNFNKGMQDIKSGTLDDIHGRFAVLGWAKSFMTYGEATRMVSWTAGDIESTTITKVDDCR